MIGIALDNKNEKRRSKDTISENIKRKEKRQTKANY